MISHLAVIERSGDPQGAGPGSTPLGKVEATIVEVHVGASTRKHPARIGKQHSLDRNHPQQVDSLRAFPAADARAAGTQRGLRV
jgi:hypothetical protein